MLTRKNTMLSLSRLSVFTSALYLRPPFAFLAAFLASFSAARLAALSPGPGGTPAGACFPANAHTQSWLIHFSCPGTASTAVCSVRASGCDASVPGKKINAFPFLGVTSNGPSFSNRVLPPSLTSFK